MDRWEHVSTAPVVWWLRRERSKAVNIGCLGSTHFLLPIQPRTPAQGMLPPTVDGASHLKWPHLDNPLQLWLDDLFERGREKQYFLTLVNLVLEGKYRVWHAPRCSPLPTAERSGLLGCEGVSVPTVGVSAVEGLQGAGLLVSLLQLSLFFSDLRSPVSYVFCLLSSGRVSSCPATTEPLRASILSRVCLVPADASYYTKH